jgi:hypothetical protein
VTSATSGSGNVTINYFVDSNIGAARTGSIHVLNANGLEVALFTISQAAAACTATSLSPAAFTFAAAGGSGSATFSTPGCSWTASSDAPWVHVQPPSGANSAPVNFTVDQNGSSINRTAHITATIPNVPSLTITINQFGVACAYTIANPNVPKSQSQSFPASGGSGGITVTATAASCGWTPTSDASFINHVTGTGSGSGSVSYSVDPNTTGLARNGTITIQGLKYLISQAAQPAEGYNCTVSAPAVPTVRAEGGAELIADLVLACSGFSGGNISGDVVVTLNTPSPITC